MPFFATLHSRLDASLKHRWEDTWGLQSGTPRIFASCVGGLHACGVEAP